jgi:hypothetical protein
MKKILFLYFSQTGQLKRIVKSIGDQLASNPLIHVTFEELKPVIPYPYPWTLLTFLDVMPRSVLSEKIELKPLSIKVDNRFDLIVVGYQPWFLSVSIPMASFLKTADAQVLFKNKPVITIIGCRGMWLMAQEKMKSVLSSLNSTLIDNAVLLDQGGAIVSLLTTPSWMLSGKKGGMGKIIPLAGVSDMDIRSASRFGTAIENGLKNDLEKEYKSLLKNYGAVTVDEKSILPEFVFYKLFLAWAKLIKFISPPGSFRRKVACFAFGIWLVCSVLMSILLGLIAGPLVAPLFRKKLNSLITYFETPSGSGYYFPK